MRENGRERPTDLHLIGSRMRKVDGLEKSTGRALFTDDITLPGMLHGKILRSPHPHARIVSIDTARAQALPGVHAVVTGKDMPVPYGIIPWTPDEYALALERVRYVGDAVAAVAAVDEDTALAALPLIDVQYEVLRAYLEPEEALAATGSYENGDFIHPARKAGRNGNVTKAVKLSFGDVDGLMDSSDVVVEGDYFFEGSTHTPIEPHCAIGRFEGDGKLTVWSSTQVPHYLHRELARVLDLDPAQVRVIQPPVGGAFGGKSEPFDLEFCVAKLSMKSGRPVKILYTREEVFYAHRGRHPFKMWYRMGASREGQINAVDARILLDGGAYASFGLVTTYYSGQLLTAPYRMGAYRFDSARVYTNKPACGPKRGHGSVQPRFAFEVQLDKLADSLALDPIELRRRNFIGENVRTVNQLRVTSNGFMECLDAVERASGWKEKFRKLRFGHGVGVAGSCYISGTNYPIYPNDMPQSAVQIQVDRSGRVAVFSGASEIGQGTDSVVAYIVAEELGVPLEWVRVFRGDTDFTPVDLGAYSSRVTLMIGNACIDACRKVKALVQDAVGQAWEVSPDRVVFEDGLAMEVEDSEGSGEGGRMIPIRVAFNLAEAKHGALGATGSYNTPKQGVHGDYRGGTIGATPAFSFTAHVAEVEVDAATGFVEVKKIWVAHDCGKALNPVLVEGQMEGSAYMGFGEALMEQQVFKDSAHGRAGLLDAPSLLDYRIPTSMDTPELESLIVESLDPEGPYGAKEAGEGPLHPSIPAIANAIYDAVGVRMDSLPFSPPRVWRKIEEARSAGSLGKPAPPGQPRSRRSRVAGSALTVALLALIAGCSEPEADAVGEATSHPDSVAAAASPPLDSIPGTNWTTEDWRILDEKVRWGVDQRLDTLSMGDALVRLGLTFVGATYTPKTLDPPGAERLVINLRELDCVTLIENLLALTWLIRNEGVEVLADQQRARRRYEEYLTTVRYRNGVLDGYASRLHYFSEWLSNNEAKGLLEIRTGALGGVVDPEPIDFMTEHRDARDDQGRLAYPQLVDQATFDAIARIEERLQTQAHTRHYIPEGAISVAESGIRDGDLIAATSTLDGLDVAHTGLAYWRDGRLHLLHAPLVGSSVEISERPLAERILGFTAQDGIMVATPQDWPGPGRSMRDATSRR